MTDKTPFQRIYEDPDLLKAVLMLNRAKEIASIYEHDAIDDETADEASMASMLHFMERAAFYLTRTYEANRQGSTRTEGYWTDWYNHWFARLRGVYTSMIGGDGYEINKPVLALYLLTNTDLYWWDVLRELSRQFPQALVNFAESGEE